MRSRGQHLVERDAQRARVEPVAALLVGLVAPAPRGDLRGQRDAAARRRVASRSVERRDQRLGGRARVADDAEVDRPVRADRLLVAVDLDHRRVRPISAPWRVVHTFSAAPKAITTSASASSRWPSGVAKPPEIPSANGSPANSPLATARGREHGAGQLAEAPQRRARRRTAPRRGRAMIAGRSARAARAATTASRSAGRTGARSGARRRGRELDLDAPARRAAGSARPSRRSTSARRTARVGVGDRRRRPVHPLGHRADRLHQRVLVDLEVRAQLRGAACRRRAGSAACGSSPPRSAP